MKSKEDIDEIIKKKIDVLKNANIDENTEKEMEILCAIDRLLTNKFETLFDKISFNAAIGILRKADVKEEDLAKTYAALVQEERNSLKYKLFEQRDQINDQER